MSFLFKIAINFLFLFLRFSKIFESRLVNSSDPSITNKTKDDSSTAIHACSEILLSILSCLLESIPPVSIKKVLLSPIDNKP